MTLYLARDTYGGNIPDALSLDLVDDFVMLDSAAKNSFHVYRPVGSNATPGPGYKLQIYWEQSYDYPGLEYALFVKIGD